MWRQEDRHKQWLVNRRIAWKQRTRSYCRAVGWDMPAKGRYWKHALHKARRRAVKDELNGRRVRGLASYESIVNWRAT